MKDFRILAMISIVAIALPAFGAASNVTLPGGETLVLWAPGSDGVGTPKPLKGAPKVAVGIDGLDKPLEVKLAVVVKADGSVAAIEPFASIPVAGVQAARVALGELNWKPAKRKGTPVNSYAVWTLRFEPKPIEIETSRNPPALSAKDYMNLHYQSMNPMGVFVTHPMSASGEPQIVPTSETGPGINPAYPRVPEITSEMEAYRHSGQTLNTETSPR